MAPHTWTYLVQLTISSGQSRHRFSVYLSTRYFYKGKINHPTTLPRGPDLYDTSTYNRLFRTRMIRDDLFMVLNTLPFSSKSMNERIRDTAANPRPEKDWTWLAGCQRLWRAERKHASPARQNLLRIHERHSTRPSNSRDTVHNLHPSIHPSNPQSTNCTKISCNPPEFLTIP